MEATNHTEMPTALTLTQFAGHIGKAISREPALCGAWVIAEISDMSVSGGHCYMTLLEKDQSGTTIARMRGTIWANRFGYIRGKFLRATGRELQSGMKVMLYGGANFHNNYGLSLNIGEIEPSYTMGDLERLRREILAQLQKEGVLGMNKALKMGDPPQRIAVISSEKAAGYGDFLHQLEGNSTGAVFYHCLFPAVMQGDRTAISVMEALELVESTRGVVDWDCVVIIRGGGATTDMNGFDNLELARRVATFPLPVVVGIGHERDRCVLDEIACVRCKTPTAVAAWLTDRVAYDWQRAIDLALRIGNYSTERMRGEGLRLESLGTMLPALVEARINGARMKLQKFRAAIPEAAHRATSAGRIRLETLRTTITMASARKIEKAQSELQRLEGLTKVLDPLATLRRGYSITRVGGKAMTGTAGIEGGTIIETQLADGKILSRVTDPHTDL